jgi:solute:Na+ symporter, SSS family
MEGVNEVALGIFIFFFALVTVLGFVAARWRRSADPDHLDEWGLGGRKFGGWITWFLVGGDLYTAYTFVAVPALMFGAGALGFFALPYTIVVYPLVFLVAPRLWSVAHKHGYVTPADFVRGRTGSASLALAIALVGILATMPYIALQLVGIEAVLKTMGVEGEWPIVIAFAILAAYTYQSGLRAPALIAFVKDSLIYIVVIAAVIYIPSKLGGWDAIFGAADEQFKSTEAPTDGLTLANAQTLGYASLAFGSACALFLYPHSVTGVLAAKSRDTVKRNMAALPAYTLILGLLALLGFMAIAAGVQPIGDDVNTIVPQLFDQMFGDVFAGVAFAAIGIGALVPAAIMSIAAANLFTRNVYKEYLRKDATPKEEAQVAKVASLVVKAGALVVILTLDPQFSIDLQLIGGVVILMTLPSIVFGLFTRWFHGRALLAGLLVGLGTGLYMLYDTPNPTTGKEHFGGSQFALSKLGFDSDSTIYTGILAVAINIVVAVVVTVVLRALRRHDDGRDATEPADYHLEAGDRQLVEVERTPQEELV